MMSKAYIYTQPLLTVEPTKAGISRSTPFIPWMQASASRFLQGGSGREARHKGQAPEISGRQGWQRRWPMGGYFAPILTTLAQDFDISFCE